MRLLVGKIHQDLLIRVFSGLVSGFLLVIIGRELTRSEFANMQIFFSYGGIIYWIFDFGLLGLAYISAAKDDLEKLGSYWTLRLIMIFCAIFLIVSGYLFGVLSSVSTLLILVGMQEVIADGHLAIRQVLRTTFANFMNVLIRKVSQFTILLCLLFFNQNLTLNSIMYVFGLPTFFTLVNDFNYFRQFLTTINIRNFRKSSKYFFQSLGTGLASFDYSLMGHFGLNYLIYPYAIGQRFARFITIPGQTYLHTIIATEVQIGTRVKEFCLRIFKPVLITFFCSTLLGIIFFLFYGNFVGRDANNFDILIVLTMIFLPLGSTISASLNGILVARSLFKYAAISTFMSSLVYLLWLCTGFYFLNLSYLVLICGVVINSLVEILLSAFFVFCKKRNVE